MYAQATREILFMTKFHRDNVNVWRVHALALSVEHGGSDRDDSRLELTMLSIKRKMRLIMFFVGLYIIFSSFPSV